MPATPTALAVQPSLLPGTVNLILFSREHCAFCRIVRQNYLLPLAARPPARLRIVEIDIDGRAIITGWNGERLTQAEFAASYRTRLSPTIRFVDSRGRDLADPIVGLSDDFFGAYLDAAVEKALAATAGGGRPAG